MVLSAVDSRSCRCNMIERNAFAIFLSMQDPSIENIDLKTTIVTCRNKRTGMFTSTAHALNLSADGKTADEAEKNLEVLLNRFLQKLAEDGRLPEMLSQIPDQEKDGEDR